MSTITKPINTLNTPAQLAGRSESVSREAVLDKHQILAQTTHRRDEANKLLETLLDAKKVSERNLASIRQDDLLKRVTGNSSMDNAISSTRRLIDSFNRVIDDLRRNLGEDELPIH